MGISITRSISLSLLARELGMLCRVQSNCWHGSGRALSGAGFRSMTNTPSSVFPGSVQTTGGRGGKKEQSGPPISSRHAEPRFAVGFVGVQLFWRSGYILRWGVVKGVRVLGSHRILGLEGPSGGRLVPPPAQRRTKPQFLLHIPKWPPQRSTLHYIISIVVV